MSKIELTLAPTYVPTWTLVDAIRELFQNALDQEVQNPENKASWEYHKDEQKSNKCSFKKKHSTINSTIGINTDRLQNNNQNIYFGESL